MKAPVFYASILTSMTTLALIALLAPAGCSKSGDTDPGATGKPVTPTPSASRPAPAPGPDAPAVVLTATDGTQHRVYVEVVSSEAKRRRGLMYRQHLPVDHGMLFIFDEMEQQSFWMKNTLIPLDMMFIDDTYRIVGIVQNAVPKTTSSRRVEGPSMYVLEVVGGWSAQHGVTGGSTVQFQNVTR